MVWLSGLVRNESRMTAERGEGGKGKKERGGREGEREREREKRVKSHKVLFSAGDITQ